MVACGIALLGLSSAAYARGGRRPAEASQIIVTHLDVTTPVGDPGANPSLDVKLDVQVTSSVGSDVTLTAVTACKVNGAVKIDTSDLGGDLSDLDVGDTKRLEASPFASSKLEGTPSQCSITIRENKEFSAAKNIAQFCYAAGHVTRGACR
jgi:hypothetical protein